MNHGALGEGASLRAGVVDDLSPCMIAHVVLFKPRPDLSAADTGLLMAALDRALREIPSVRRAIVGPRSQLGATYEQLPQPDFSYAAIVEFDDRKGLQDYLAHPAHDELGRRFWAALEATMIFDFEMEQRTG